MKRKPALRRKETKMPKRKKKIQTRISPMR
jgi:hypothetical protein